MIEWTGLEFRVKDAYYHYFMRIIMNDPGFKELRVL